MLYVIANQYLYHTYCQYGHLGLSTNYRGITLTAIHEATKIYNKMLLNRVQSSFNDVLRKAQNGFHQKMINNWSNTGSETDHRRKRAKNLPSVVSFVDFLKAFNSIEVKWNKLCQHMAFHIEQSQETNIQSQANWSTNELKLEH